MIVYSSLSLPFLNSVCQLNSLLLAALSLLTFFAFGNWNFLVNGFLALKALVIKGEELEIIKLDTYQGNVSLKGKINSVFYADSSTRKEKENSFFNKLFK